MYHCCLYHTYLRSQNLILLSKWPLMIVCPIPLPATMSLQLEPANRVLVPGMGMGRVNCPDQNKNIPFPGWICIKLFLYAVSVLVKGDILEGFGCISSLHVLWCKSQIFSVLSWLPVTYSDIMVHNWISLVFLIQYHFRKIIIIMLELCGSK